MSDIHIDDFYRDVARTLVWLYAHFPRKATLLVEDIIGPDTPDEYGLPSSRHEACFHTMLWLARNDYLGYESPVRQEALDQVVLSHRAFVALTAAHHAPSYAATPGFPTNVAREEQQFIYRLRHELKYGNSFSLARTVRELMLMAHPVC